MNKDNDTKSKKMVDIVCINIENILLKHAIKYSDLVTKYS